MGKTSSLEFSSMNCRPPKFRWAQIVYCMGLIILSSIILMLENIKSGIQLNEVPTTFILISSVYTGKSESMLYGSYWYGYALVVVNKSNISSRDSFFLFRALGKSNNTRICQSFVSYSWNSRSYSLCHFSR